MKKVPRIVRLAGLGVAGLLLMLGAGVAAVVAAARAEVGPAVAIVEIMAGSIAEAGQVEPSAATPAQTKTTEPQIGGIMYATTERVVNLADKGTLRYVKAQVILELSTPNEKLKAPLTGEALKKKQEELVNELGGRTVVIDDMISSILSSKTSADLVTSDGKALLKQELKDRLDKVTGERRVLNVYFTQFIIQ